MLIEEENVKIQKFITEINLKDKEIDEKILKSKVFKVYNEKIFSQYNMKVSEKNQKSLFGGISGVSKINFYNPIFKNLGYDLYKNNLFSKKAINKIFNEFFIDDIRGTEDEIIPFINHYDELRESMILRSGFRLEVELTGKVSLSSIEAIFSKISNSIEIYIAPEKQMKDFMKDKLKTFINKFLNKDKNNPLNNVVIKLAYLVFFNSKFINGSKNIQFLPSGFKEFFGFNNCIDGDFFDRLSFYTVRDLTEIQKLDSTMKYFEQKTLSKKKHKILKSVGNFLLKNPNLTTPENFLRVFVDEIIKLTKKQNRAFNEEGCTKPMIRNIQLINIDSS